MRLPYPIGLAFLAAVICPGEQPPAAPEITSSPATAVFRSSTNLVQVPVVVRDSSGHAVGTLRAEDFQLLDGGKPQVISRFSVEQFDTSVSVQTGAGPNAVARLEMPLAVEPWNSASFGISDIALSTEIRAVDPVPSTGGPVLEGRGPLMAGGRQFVPAASNRFRRSGQIYFYTEVYDPALGGANPSSPTMQYRILDKKTGEVKLDSGVGSVASFVRPGNPLVPFATRLAVAELPAGSYRLEVRAANPSVQDAVARTVDFELQ
jgi:hypothetical protein